MSDEKIENWTLKSKFRNEIYNLLVDRIEKLNTRIAILEILFAISQKEANNKQGSNKKNNKQ